MDFVKSYKSWVEKRGGYVCDLQRKEYLGSKLTFSFFQTDDLPLHCPSNVLSWNHYSMENLLRNNSKDSLNLHLTVYYINSMIHFDSSGLNDIIVILWEREVKFKLEVILFRILSVIFMKVLILHQGKIELKSWRMCFIL